MINFMRIYTFIFFMIFLQRHAMIFVSILIYFSKRRWHTKKESTNYFLGIQLQSPFLDFITADQNNTERRKRDESLYKNDLPE